MQDLVVSCEEHDAVPVVDNLDFLDDAHLSSRTMHESCDSRPDLVGSDGLLFVRVARGEGDVSGESFHVLAPD